MNQRSVAILLVSLATLIYGVTFTIAKDVMPIYVKPFGFIFVRVTGATAIFWLVGLFVKTEKIEKQDYKNILLAAFFGIALNMMTFFKGTQSDHSHQRFGNDGNLPDHGFAFFEFYIKRKNCQTKNYRYCCRFARNGHSNHIRKQLRRYRYQSNFRELSCFCERRIVWFVFGIG